MPRKDRAPKAARETLSSRKSRPAPGREPPPNPGVNPAVADHATPKESPPFPIVAIGASAGGLEAFTELLQALPADTGMAFVFIQHLLPTHESLLSAILTRSTEMKVHEVENNMAVRPNNVYVIPPGKNMVLGHGLLQLAPRTEVRGVARPVDHFMRSLAEEHGHKAIGVVLSGTGNDGTLGLEEIKAGGGLTFAQDTTAEQGGMPSAAIGGGAVDLVLPAGDIARELGRIAKHPYVAPGTRDDAPVRDSAFMRVVDALAEGADVDFANYKKNTLYRRITRRMMLRRIDGMHEYAELLRRDPAELESLYQDVLISVTSFFRNPEAYESLKVTVFPKLAAEAAKGAEIRVWALGCSTGEEAYSIAMSFTEYLEASGKRIGLQVFATDLNSAGIERARAGVYSKGITQDVSPERLRRFFVDIDGSYRIAKPIRDMCVFARQNVLTDPPFSRIDLVACRNVLIYLEPLLQQRLIPMLHFALRPHGFLWLGGSETVGAHRQLFDLVDPRNKIYAKKPGGHDHPVPALGTVRPAASAGVSYRSHRVARVAPQRAARPNGDPQGEADRVLLERYAPPAVVVDAALDIVQYRGDTAAYLSPTPGKASLSLLKMLREGLTVPVRGAIHRAREEGKPVRVEDVRGKFGNGRRSVDVVAVPLAPGSGGGFVVLFEEPDRGRESRKKTRRSAGDARIDRREAGGAARAGKAEVSRLGQELAATREYLESVIEEQEAANEELQSANEEAQSTNEELQSVNEELETSKEEIQSSNEELTTLNQELSDRNNELARSNDDLLNFMSSVHMAIVMVSGDLRIRRFTPMAEKKMNLLAADLGRSIADIRTGLTLDNLEELIGEVMDTVSVREREVQDRAGHWYSLRVRPYRTLDNKIDGAVLALVDIDDLKRAQYALMESERRFELLANSAPVMIWVNDREGARFVNRAFEEFIGATEHDIQIAEPSHYVHPEERVAYLEAYNRAFEEKEPFEIRCRFRRADGTWRWMKSVAVPSFLPNGELLGLVGCTFDITDMKDAEAALMEFDRGKNEFLAMLAHELRNPLAGIRNASRVLSVSQDPSEQEKSREIIERQTGHMARMVDDLLDVARVTHRKIVLRNAPLDLAALARKAISATEPARADRQQALTPSLPAEPLWVEGDAMRLEQVFVNLLDNATKFTRNGGHIWVDLAREAAARLREGSPAVPVAVARVRDNGMGIDRALLPHVFELFTQAHLSTDRARAGIGLGLALAKRLLDLHGGTLEAHSAGNALGSEFVLRLPLLPTARIPAAPSKQPPQSAQRTSRKVLVVDDDRDAAESLRMLLALAGHEVAVAHDGAAALAMAASFRPKAVILDIALPDMDGYEVARRLRADGAARDALIVALTGFGHDEDQRKAREAGIDEHLIKPLDPERLAEYLERGRR